MKKEKKREKFLSSRIYRLILRRLLLNNLIVPFLFLGLLAGPAATLSNGISTFLILEGGETFQNAVTAIKTLGGTIRQKVPPKVLVTSLPESIEVSDLPFVEKAFRTVIPVSELEPLGPLALAAGLQWNRTQAHSAKTQGKGVFRGMQALLQTHALPPPENVDVKQEGSLLVCQWDDVPGALLYEFQVSNSPDFSNLLRVTQTPRTSIILATPENQNLVYYRLRTLDRLRGATDSNELIGGWSPAWHITLHPQSPEAVLSPPTLTSPLNGFESEGFTVIPEWEDHAAAHTRIQVAASANFETPLIDVVTDKRDFVVPSSALRVDETYHWRLQGWGPQKSPWSAAREFHINPPRPIGTDTFINPERPR